MIYISCDKSRSPFFTSRNTESWKLFNLFFDCMQPAVFGVVFLQRDTHKRKAPKWIFYFTEIFKNQNIDSRQMAAENFLLHLIHSSRTNTHKICVYLSMSHSKFSFSSVICFSIWSNAEYFHSAYLETAI